jgi:hypothetical protein
MIECTECPGKTKHGKLLCKNCSARVVDRTLFWSFACWLLICSFTIAAISFVLITTSLYWNW